MSSSGSSRLTEILNGHVRDDSVDEGLLAKTRAVGPGAFDPFCGWVWVGNDLLLVPGEDAWEETRSEK